MTGRRETETREDEIMEARELAHNLPVGQLGEVDDRPAKIVYSSRIPSVYSEEIAAAAADAEVTPSAMIAVLVGEALQARRLHASQRVTVDLATLHRLVDQIAEAA